MSCKSFIVCVYSNLYHLQKIAGAALVRGMTCTSSLQIIHEERNSKQPVYSAVQSTSPKPPLPLQSVKNPSFQHCITNLVFNNHYKALFLPSDKKRTQPVVLMHELVTHKDTFFVRHVDDLARRP